MTGTGRPDPAKAATGAPIVRPFVGRATPRPRRQRGRARTDEVAVRPYALTGGRTRSRSARVGIETIVVTTAVARARELRFERREIAALCTTPQSVAELSVELGVPVGVARVLAGDMAADGLLDAHTAVDPGADVALLTRLIDGIRAL